MMNVCPPLSGVDCNFLPTECHTQNNKRREGGLLLAEAGRAEGQAEIKAEQERKPDTQDMLGVG
jgi:hypothetical protein